MKKTHMLISKMMGSQTTQLNYKIGKFNKYN